MFFTANFLTKMAQMFGDFLGYLEMICFKVKLLWLLFGQLKENFRLLYIPTFCHSDGKHRWIPSSVTRWLDYVCIFGHLHKTMPNCITSLLKQVQNCLLKCPTKERNFAKSGHTEFPRTMTLLFFLTILYLSAAPWIPACQSC